MVISVRTMVAIFFFNVLIPCRKSDLSFSDQLLSLTRVVSGKTFRKYPTAITINPKKPSEINPSDTLKGMDCASWFKAGPSSRRCSSQIPMITTEQIIIIRIGLVFIRLFNRMKNGPIKQIMNTVQASLFQGASMVRTIT